MELLERFADLLFQEMPPGEEAELAKAEILSGLEADYNQNLRDGMSPDGALAQTLVCFGALDAAENAYRRQKLLRRQSQFERLYQPLRRYGLLSVAVLPLSLLILLTGLGFRTAGVTIWLLSLLGLLVFLAALEWHKACYIRQLAEISSGEDEPDSEDERLNTEGES